MGTVKVRIYRIIGLELLWVLSELGLIGLELLWVLSELGFIGF